MRCGQEILCPFCNRLGTWKLFNNRRKEWKGGGSQIFLTTDRNILSTSTKLLDINGKSIVSNHFNFDWVDHLF